MLLQHNMDHGGVPILKDFRPVPHIEIFFLGGGRSKNIYWGHTTLRTGLWGHTTLRTDREVYF